ncbi:MAG: TolC family protein [Spirochaetales bacterium]|nr:TolC family protein [Spirochaetales bacterium]
MKGTRKKGALLLGVLLGGLLPLGAESLTLSEIILLARENNPDLLEAQNSLVSAENDLMGLWRVEESSLKISSDWSPLEESSYQSLTDHGSGTLSLSVPLIDQISLDSSLDTDQDISAGFTVKPLNMTDDTAQSQVTLDNALTDLLYTESNLDWDVLNLALSLALAEKDEAAARAWEELENRQYQASYALYLVGDITYDELLDAMDDLTDAEDDSLAYSTARLDASQDLWAYLSHYGDNELAPPSLDETEALADRLLELAASLEESPTLSQDVSEARNELILAERDRDITLEFHPDLSFSADVSGNLTDSSETEVELSLSVTLSEGSFNKREQTILAAEVEVKKAELNRALFESEMERESLLAAIDQAEKARESAQRDLERKAVLAAETALLYEKGDRTILEKLEADLELTEAENKLFQRYTEEIGACADYLALYPQSGIDVLALF